MNTRGSKAKGIVFILVTILMVTFGTQSISYGQEANPTITVSVEAPLTEATLHESVITLTLSGGRFTDREWDIRDALTISGIEGITIVRWPFLNRVSATEVTVPLIFDGNIDTDATLTVTVGAGAIVDYNGNALTATLPVTAVEESLEASTEAPLTEATLHGSTITLTLTGRRFVDEWYIDDALSLSGIEGVTVSSSYPGVERVSDTVATVYLAFSGNIDTDATLTLTVGPDAIVGGYDKAFTFQFPVTAVEESLEASTEAPLTEAMLNGGINVALSLTGRRFTDREWGIERALSVSGIEGVTVGQRFRDVERVSDTEVKVRLTFSGNIDEDATLTLTVGAEAIAGYDKAFTFQFPVTAVEESLEASTEAPLTEAMLNGGIITLKLTGRRFVDEYYIRRALSLSGIEGVTLAEYDAVQRVNGTVAIIELEFAGNIDEDATLTLTVDADAIGYDKDFTFQLPVTAVEESLETSTEAPLTEAMLNGGIITLKLTGRRFVDEYYIRRALSLSGIEGVTLAEYDAVQRVSDTVAIIELEFVGNIDEDATLTLTVGLEAMGYNKAFTFQLPVTAVEESLTASTEFPLTEATLDGSTITFSLSGRRFADREYDQEDDLSVSGIDGVRVVYSERVSDTEIAVWLRFDSTDFDTDATLTFTVGASVANYNKPFTAQVPVTAIQNTNATVSISPSQVISPNIGEPLTLNLNIIGGKNIAGYQATVLFDDSTLEYIESANGDYLPVDAFFLTNYYSWNDDEVTLTASTLTEAANGDGTLATLTFEVVDFKPSTVTLSEVYLVDANGKRWEVTTENGAVTIPPEPENAILGDLNRDGVVNIQDLVIVSVHFGQRGQNSADVNGDHLVDIVDLVLVASAVNAAAAPPLNPQALKSLTAGDVQSWLSQARQLTFTDLAYLRGITVLEQLLKTLTPKKTILLPNYPNPFNPETWIPYHLSNDVDVQISIYNTKGVLVRQLDLGHRMAGYYIDRTKAAYWDGKNEFGEQVASGVYFYHLSAGKYSATRKMLILK